MLAGRQAEVQVQKCRFPLPELQAKVQNPKVQKCRIWAPRSASAEVQIIFPAWHSRSADSRKCKCRIWSAECRNSVVYPPWYKGITLSVMLHPKKTQDLGLGFGQGSRVSAKNPASRIFREKNFLPCPS